MRRLIIGLLAAMLVVALAPVTSADEGGVYGVQETDMAPLLPTPSIERLPGNPDPFPAWLAVPRFVDAPPMTDIPAEQELSCADLGSTIRAKVYLDQRPGAWVRIDTDQDGLPCEGWTWGNGEKPLCETQALRDERSARLWVLFGVKVRCMYDGEYGFSMGSRRMRGTGFMEWITMDGDYPPPRGNPIIDTTLVHELGHRLARVTLTEEEKARIMDEVPGLDTKNGWFGPGDYPRIPSEAFAESWVHCATSTPWRDTYTQVPCWLMRRVLGNL